MLDKLGFQIPRIADFGVSDSTLGTMHMIPVFRLHDIRKTGRDICFKLYVLVEQYKSAVR